MQHVTAFSPPQTVPAAPAVARKPNLWILSSWRDLILYVCTPLLIVPMFVLAQTRWSAEDIYLFVAAFGAMGHHLPGMIRAYGDRALFQRFKWRFIFAPIFLVVVCTIFFFVGPQRHCADRLYLGRLARHDANVWILSHLRCESGLIRCADASSRFRNVRDLVCNRRPSLIAANDRCPGNLLFRGGAFHSAGTPPSGPASVVCVGPRGFRRISGKFYLDVDPWEATKSGKAGASHHEHFFLVVLQQHRGEHSRRRCVVRSIPRCPVPLAGLDL